jgi:hypothetical protein
MNKSIHFGSFTATLFTNRNLIQLSYAGNMGTRMADMQAVIDECFGKGAWQRIEPHLTKQTGHPDYLWTAVIKPHAFPYMDRFGA